MTAKKNEVATTNNENQLSFNLGDFDEFRTGKGEEIIGLEAIDRSDIKLPKIKLIQSTSVEAQKGKCPAGHFFNVVTGETYPELRCKLLVLGKSRVMWKKPFKRGEEPLCRSFDGVLKFDGTKKCANCQYQSWDNIAEGDNKPACNMSYVWLGLDENKKPFRLIASGASVAPTKNFLNKILPNKLPPFVYNVIIRTEQKENESGIFYVMTYEIDDKNPTIAKEDFMPLKELAEGMRDMFMTANQIDSENIVEDADMAMEAEKEGGLF
ncbi:MAG TPA: hypothetical protein PKK61_11840 [Defluviitaleaceae bacterium]|nr:hypothetical protein [Defluviitaleaceae bacterium]